MTSSVNIDIASSDLADLEEWARNSEQSVGDLLQEALQRYLRDAREDNADLRRRMEGPFHPLEEVKTRLAESRRNPRSQAAE